MDSSASALREFLRPLDIDIDKVHRLSEAYYATFRDLAANDSNQFLPTPISESILRPVSEGGGHGKLVRARVLCAKCETLTDKNYHDRHLAIDM